MTDYHPHDIDWTSWAVTVIAGGQFFVQRKALQEAINKVNLLRLEADNLEKSIQGKIAALNKATHL